MLNLQTLTVFSHSPIKFSYKDKIVVFGSCFSDSIGTRMQNAGFNVLVNPFGTMYNPVSIAHSLSRLDSGTPFTFEECVEMGANAGLICSYNHHTSFARPTAEEFLANANASLAEASAFWHEANLVFITLGTSFCYKLKKDGEIVANCLKRPADEFERKFLSLQHSTAVLDTIISRYPDKKFIFTVSPIRHLADGAHMNQLSKSSLLLAVDAAVTSPANFGRATYFPAYEIVLDELRDYRFYSEDMLHLSQQTQQYIWERFCDFALLAKDQRELMAKEKAWRRLLHRPLHY